MAVSAATEAPRVFFRPLKFPEGWAAILTNPGPECRVRLTFHDPVREVDEVLTARRLAPTTVGHTHEIEVLVPAGGVAVVRGR